MKSMFSQSPLHIYPTALKKRELFIKHCLCVQHQSLKAFYCINIYMPQFLEFFQPFMPKICEINDTTNLSHFKLKIHVIHTF